MDNSKRMTVCSYLRKAYKRLSTGGSIEQEVKLTTTRTKSVRLSIVPSSDVIPRVPLFQAVRCLLAGFDDVEFFLVAANFFS